MKDILRRILVATDGSATGDRALSLALAIAQRHRSEILLCYVVDHARAYAECSSADGGVDLLIPLVQALDDAATSILAAAVQRATDAGLLASSIVLEGHAAHAIVTAAAERQIDAIVMGTQGKRGFERFFLGSTADGVLRGTSVPVFVVPPGTTKTDATFDRMLVAVDDSDPSDAAAAFALDIAQADCTRVVFCCVAETSALVSEACAYGYDPTMMRQDARAASAVLLATQTDRARARNLATESVLAEGDATDEILLTAQEQHADIIVVGTHGRRGLRRLFVGSVAENVVRRSVVPVVIVRIARPVASFAARTTAATSAPSR